MANEFWTILGKLSTNETFRTGAMARSVPHPVELPAMLRDLRDFLVADGFHVSRFQVAEVNRMLQARQGVNAVNADHLGDATGPFCAIRGAAVALWRPEPTEPGVWEVLGLAAIDHEVRSRLAGAAKDPAPAAFDAALAAPPGFALPSSHAACLRELFRSDEVLVSLANIEAWGWKIPMTPTLPSACDAAFEVSAEYRHASQEDVYEMRAKLLPAASEGRPGPVPLRRAS